MRWGNQEESRNVEDRRGWGRAGLALGGGGGLVALLIALFLGINPGRVQLPEGQQGGPVAQRADPAEERLAHFSKVIFHDTEVVWGDLFQRMGREYLQPTLVLYTGAVQSGCGFAQAAVGPFYCARDRRVYIDLSFYRDMERKLRAPGDFARAYVIAHEVGHHVQRLLGFGTGRQPTEGDRNHASVRLELQADFLAGVWAYHAQRKFHFLEEGDLESALNAAFQIGDDRLQMRARGYVVPDSFTHGSSRQRVEAFRSGFTTGDVRLAKRFFSDYPRSLSE